MAILTGNLEELSRVGLARLLFRTPALPKRASDDFTVPPGKSVAHTREWRRYIKRRKRWLRTVRLAKERLVEQWRKDRPELYRRVTTREQYEQIITLSMISG